MDTCLALGIDPERYLIDVIDKLEGGWPLRLLSELIPQNWAAEKAAEQRRAGSARDSPSIPGGLSSTSWSSLP